MNLNDASVIKVSDYYCLCRLKTLHLCALQYLTALAFVPLISDCINHTDSSCCICAAAGPISQHASALHLLSSSCIVLPTAAL